MICVSVQQYANVLTDDIYKCFMSKECNFKQTKLIHISVHSDFNFLITMIRLWIFISISWHLWLWELLILWLAEYSYGTESV